MTSMQTMTCGGRRAGEGGIGAAEKGSGRGGPRENERQLLPKDLPGDVLERGPGVARDALRVLGLARRGFELLALRAKLRESRRADLLRLLVRPERLAEERVRLRLLEHVERVTRLRHPAAGPSPEKRLLGSQLSKRFDRLFRGVLRPAGKNRGSGTPRKGSFHAGERGSVASRAGPGRDVEGLDGARGRGLGGEGRNWPLHILFFFFFPLLQSFYRSRRRPAGRFFS